MAYTPDNISLIEMSAIEEPPFAKQVAQALIDTVNFELHRRVETQIRSWEMLWENPRVSPVDILTALGSQAPLIFAIATENCAHINRAAEAVGKSVTDFLPEKYLSVPEQYRNLV